MLFLTPILLNIGNRCSLRDCVKHHATPSQRLAPASPHALDQVACVIHPGPASPTIRLRNLDDNKTGPSPSTGLSRLAPLLETFKTKLKTNLFVVSYSYTNYLAGLSFMRLSFFIYQFV